MPVKPLNDLLGFVYDIAKLLSSSEIAISKDFHQRVSDVEEVLESDTSGLVNTILDFAIDCACTDYRIEVDNDTTLTEVLNDWLGNINIVFIGKGVEVGIKGIARQYFIERWKQSSLCVLKLVWEKVGEFKLPTKIVLYDGKSIRIKSPSKLLAVGDKKYFLKVSDNEKDDIELKNTDTETIYVCKPFEKWEVDYPIPYVIKKGIYKNLKMLDLLEGKAEKMVGKALEYLMVMKKGTENLALQGKAVYDEKDLQNTAKDFKNFLSETRSNGGTNLYATQFDTEIEHLIPEYSRILEEGLYTPIEKRILAGLGLVDIVQGITSTRKESTLNPRPFVRGIEQGIKDFSSFIRDVLELIKQKNPKHIKYNARTVHIYTAPIQDFIVAEVRKQLATAYSRGCLSYQTYIEVCLDQNYEVEKEHKRKELDNEDEVIFYPPVIQNQENQTSTTEIKKDKIEKRDKNGKLVPEDKNNPETKEKYTDGAVLEGAPYKNIDELPENVKDPLPSKAQILWMDAFNKAYPKGEDYARRVAWYVVKKAGYKKGKDNKWHKEQGFEIEQPIEEITQQILEGQIEIKDEDNGE